jgi:hypothetical protein
MRLFQQDAHGVGVYDGNASYADTVENFTSDYGGPPPAMPPGITLQVYEPGKRHALNADNSTVDGGPMPWPEGDAVIAAVGSLIAAQRARQEQAQPKPAF